MSYPKKGKTEKLQKQVGSLALGLSHEQVAIRGKVTPSLKVAGPTREEVPSAPSSSGDSKDLTMGNISPITTNKKSPPSIEQLKSLGLKRT